MEETTKENNNEKIMLAAFAAVAFGLHAVADVITIQGDANVIGFSYRIGGDDDVPVNGNSVTIPFQNVKEETVTISNVICADGYMYANLTAEGADVDEDDISLFEEGAVITINTIPAPKATVTAAPTAAEPLFYTGAAQTLINAGTASGGEMQYKLGDGEWSASLPTATDVGDYTVYYKAAGSNGNADSDVASVAVAIYTLDLSTLTADYEAAGGDILFGETTCKVTVPSGATVRINGIALAGGAASPVTPEFAEGGEAVTTKFEKGEGNTWKITAFAEMSNESRGTDVTASQLKVYRASSLEGLKTAEAMTSGVTLTKKTSAVKVTLEAEEPTDAKQQFFRVGFGQ